MFDCYTAKLRHALNVEVQSRGFKIEYLKGSLLNIEKLKIRPLIEVFVYIDDLHFHTCVSPTLVAGGRGATSAAVRTVLLGTDGPPAEFGDGIQLLHDFFVIPELLFGIQEHLRQVISENLAYPIAPPHSESLKT